MTDIVTRLEKWFELTNMPGASDWPQMAVDLREAIGTIKGLRGETSPWLHANHVITLHDFRIWVEPIKKKFWDDATKTSIEHEAFAIRAMPISASSFYAYAYKNESDASLVASRIAGRFDIQTWRVNFSADNNPVCYREEMFDR